MNMIKEMIIEADMRTRKLREDGRDVDELRVLKATKDFNLYAEGSVLMECGNTKVICTATVSDKVKVGLQLSTLWYLEQLEKETKENLPREN